MNVSVLLLALLAVATPDQAASRYLSGAAAEAAAADKGADVLTPADMRQALDLEAQKQLASCDAASSCMAELAAAMDARLMISGTVLAIGNEYTLQFVAYDVKRAASAARKSLRASSIQALGPEVARATNETLAEFRAASGSTERVRVLVLDFDVSGAVGGVELSQGAPGGSKVRWLPWVGAVAAVVGAAGLGTAGWFLFVADEANARMPTSTPLQQKPLHATVESSLGMAAATGAVGVVGVGVGIAAFVLDAREE